MYVVRKRLNSISELKGSYCFFERKWNMPYFTWFPGYRMAVIHMAQITWVWGGATLTRSAELRFKMLTSLAQSSQRLTYSLQECVYDENALVVVSRNMTLIIMTNG